MIIANELFLAFREVDKTIARRLELLVTSVNSLIHVVKDGKLIFSVVPSNAFVLGRTYSEVHEKRQPIKLVSFLIKHLEVTEKEALDFVEKTRSIILGTDITFSVTFGEGIRKAYNVDNYIENAESNLRSCMSHKDQQLYLDMYVYNPKTIKLLVARVKGKVAGRALIFKGYRKDDKDKKILNLQGRIYFHSQRIQKKMQLWFSDRKYASFDGTVYRVPLEYWDFNYYPYMDNSFSYISKTEKCLTNERLIKDGIQCSQGGNYDLDLKDSIQDKLDPKRPGKVFFRKEWVKGKDIVTVNGDKYKRSETFTCTVCKTLSINPIDFRGKQMCSTHNVVYYKKKLYLYEELYHCEEHGFSETKCIHSKKTKEKVVSEKRIPIAPTFYTTGDTVTVTSSMNSVLAPINSILDTNG